MLSSPVNELIEYRQYVEGTGYMWADSELEDGSPAGRRLVFGVDDSSHGASYEPLRDTRYRALFRTFADTETSEAGILRFAGRFGMLGSHGSLVRTPFHGDYLLMGETLDTWKFHILRMRSLIVLSDLLEKGDKEGLVALVRLTPDFNFPVFFFHVSDDPQDNRRAAVYFDSFHPELHSPEHILVQTRMCLEREINQALQRDASPCVRYSEEDGKLHLTLSVSSLAGALWLQFALAVTGDKEYRPCTECGMWLEIAPDTYRTNRGYCSDACRAKAYRDRKRKAKEMAAAGHSVAAIAAELGVDDRSVAKWVQSAGRD